MHILIHLFTSIHLAISWIGRARGQLRTGCTALGRARLRAHSRHRRCGPLPRCQRAVFVGPARIALAGAAHATAVSRTVSWAYGDVARLPPPALVAAAACIGAEAVARARSRAEQPLAMRARPAGIAQARARVVVRTASVRLVRADASGAVGAANARVLGHRTVDALVAGIAHASHLKKVVDVAAAVARAGSAIAPRPRAGAHGTVPPAPASFAYAVAVDALTIGR